MPNLVSEEFIAKRFAAWFSREKGKTYTVARGNDPPDFVMEPEGWLEISGVYLNNAQAKFINRQVEKRFSFQCATYQTALRLLQGRDEKLAKPSYESVFKERGPGILLLTCQDPFFDEVNLEDVNDALQQCCYPPEDKGCFKIGYFEYRLPYDAKHTYMQIYPLASSA